MSPEDFIPLKAVQHLVLLLLAEEPTYGVELMDRLEARSAGAMRLNAGSLYRTIASLVEDGLIRPTEPVSDGVGAPKKIYDVSALGRDVLRAEALRQADLLALAESLDLVGEG